MKSIILIAAFVCTALAVPVKKNERYIEVIGADNKVHLVDLEEPVDEEFTKGLDRNAGNRYLLFTRSNPTSGQRLEINNAQSITSSNFDPNRPTVVIVHGWLGNQNTEINPLIRNAYLQNYDMNVIVLDWGRIAIGSYINAIASVPSVGRGLGQFLAFLNSVTGASFADMHLAGFSLGSHVVGNAGRELGGRVGRVTGLDPISPVWDNNSNRLNRKDGVYVEIIHTNGRGRGVNEDIGDADFYPNGGSNQPGCLTSVCNHNRSWELFAATVAYDHLVGKKCESPAEVAANTCQGPTMNMGNGIPNKNGSGLYRLETTSKYPY